jgi:hypothetical protein
MTGCEIRSRVSVDLAGARRKGLRGDRQDGMLRA